MAKPVNAAALKAAAPDGACGFDSRSGHSMWWGTLISDEANRYLNDALGQAHKFSPGLPGRGGMVVLATAKSIDRAAGVPDPPRAKRRVRRVSPEEQIAQRVFNRQRDSVILFLRQARLGNEMKELVAVEKELANGDERARKHAAFSARNLMQGVADRLFPPTAAAREGHDGRGHSLGAKNYKNRLIAYAEDGLQGSWERHELMTFVSVMDSVCRWTGSGPHGTYGREAAEYAYTQMLDVLAVLALAFRAQASES
jgi:hypothetical protein